MNLENIMSMTKTPKQLREFKDEEIKDLKRPELVKVEKKKSYNKSREE